ncbi:MAG TPA: hypothetical protein PLK37_14490, partial [Terricaulis sp.]|nr:hypothetical protein [Terricaulis sp.]
ERNWAVCDSRQDSALRLHACSAVISAESVAPERRVQALVTRGEVRLAASQHVRAIADFGRALRLDARNTQALFQRGVAHYERAGYQAAARDFAAVLEIDPQHALAPRWRDEARDALGADYEDRLAGLDEAIAQAPRDGALRNNRCWLRATHGRDLEQALADCDEALRLEPGNENALDSRGLVQYKRGDFEAALADYDAALAVDAERGHYMYGRALALQALGRVEEASAAFSAAEKAEPGVAALYYSYGAPGPA